MARIPVPANTSPTVAKIAAVDLSAHMFRAVKIDANGKFAKAGAGEVCTGIMVDDPKAGEVGTAQVKDICRFEAAEAFTPETLLASDADGKARIALAGDYILAKALQGAAAGGAIVEVQLIHSGTKAAATPEPTVVSATATADGLTVEVKFSKNMANPAGKHAFFNVAIDGVADVITAAALKGGDATTIILTMTTAITANKVLTVNYTKGTIVAADGGVLDAFANFIAANPVA